MAVTSLEQVNQIRRELAEFDLSRSQCPVDRRRAAKEAEERARTAHETQEQQRVVNWEAAIDRRIDRFLATWWGNGEDGAWRDKLFEAVGGAMGMYVNDRLEEERRAFDAKLAALEDRLASHQGEIATHDDEAKRGVVIRAIDEVRAETRKWAMEQIEAERRSFEAKLAALEERFKSSPGKLPVAKTWREASVTYQAEFVSHNGALYQAKRDTAQAPGNNTDWICVARAGRDGRSPTIRGIHTRKIRRVRHCHL